MRMQQVGHDVLGQIAVVIQERRIDVQERDILPLGKFLDDLVDLVFFPCSYLFFNYILSL